MREEHRIVAINIVPSEFGYNFEGSERFTAGRKHPESGECIQKIQIEVLAALADYFVENESKDDAIRLLAKALEFRRGARVKQYRVESVGDAKNMD